MSVPQNASIAGTWKTWAKCLIATTDQANLGQQNTMTKSEPATVENLMLYLPMWKSILIMLVTLGAVIVALSLAAVGLTKLLGWDHIPQVALIMTPTISHLTDDQYPLVKLILTLMRFGSGGPSCIQISDISG